MSAVTPNLEAAIALALLAAALIGLPRAYLSAWRWLRPPAPEDEGGTARVVALATAAAALLRFVVAPRWIVTVFIGYLLTAQAIELSPASHYGMGSQALYHALFAVLPWDHRYLLWTNSVLGVAALPLWAAAAGRLLGDRRAGAAFAVLLALTPLFIKNDNSDANHVPCLLWLAGGLVLQAEWSATGAREALLAGLGLLATAAIGRPEMPILVPLFALAAAACAPPPRERLRDPVLYIGLLVAALLVLPHALHVRASTDMLASRSALPGFGLDRLRDLGRLMLHRNTVLDPRLYPVALVPLAVLGLAVRDPAVRRGRIALALLVPVALGVYSLDLCRANMARVHVPGALVVTMLAAAGLARAFARLPSPIARAAIALLLVASAVPTAARLWAPTNEQAEEALVRESLDRLPAGPYTLVRMAREDRDPASPGSEFTHHHFPDYLVRPPAGTGRVSSIGDWMAEPDLAAPAFFYLGVRCYAEFRADGTPPPRGDALQPACARMRERWDLEPVVEHDLPNRGDVWIEYYGDAPSLRVGLYRIRPKTGTTAPAR